MAPKASLPELAPKAPNRTRNAKLTPKTTELASEDPAWFHKAEIVLSMAAKMVPKDPNWPRKLLKSSRWLPKAQNGLKVPGAKARVFDS